MSILLATPSYGQNVYSRRVIDLSSPLSQDMIELMYEMGLGFGLADIERITRDIQLVAQDYSLEPNLLLALMAGEDEYWGYAQTRLYYFNLDTGHYADEDDFPLAWYDVERVARSYCVEYERYEEKTAAIAAYFVGYRQLSPDGDISGQSDDFKNLVGTILTLDAEWSHLGEGGGPQVLAVNDETPATSFEYIHYDLTEVEQAYIRNMVYFNPGLTEELAQEIFAAIHQHASDFQAVDARLVMALVACESSFRPDAVSHAGAQGLGQLMPFTAEGFGVDDPFDVNENIRATFAYLDRELERWADYNYTLDRVLAAYNAGPGRVEQYSDPPHNGIPQIQETMNYVPKVVNIYYYFLPEDERAEKLLGATRYVTEENGSILLAP